MALKNALERMNNAQLAVVETILLGLRRHSAESGLAMLMGANIKGIKYSFYFTLISSFSLFYFSFSVSFSLSLSLSYFFWFSFYSKFIFFLCSCFILYYIQINIFPVECTKILLESGYSTLEDINPDNSTSTQYSLNDLSSKPEAVTVSYMPDFTLKTKRDIITMTPEAHVEVRWYSEHGSKAQPREEDLESSLERLIAAKSHAWV